MKKAFFTLFLIVMFIIGCATGGTTPASNLTADDLDPAIREASTYLNTRIPQGRKAVFLNITSDYPDLSEYILSLLSENAVNDGIFSVVDRVQLDALRTEMNFQLSGEVDDDSAQAIGKLLGAQTIVSGAANKIGSLYRLQVKAIEVQTASVQGQWSKTVPGGGVIISALTDNMVPASRISPVVATMPAVTPASSSSVTAQATTPATPPVETVQVTPLAPVTSSAPVTPAEPPIPVYRIGDTGPAGGIIFYDKGNNSGGWRYLEATPADIGRVQWQSSTTNVNGTQDSIGSGKENTQLAIRHNVRPAMLCDQYSLGGYEDWFLPSKGELDLMYINLKMIRGIGNFTDGWYWSSTQYSGGSYAAWAHNFSSGSQSDLTKSSTSFVRAVRAF